MGAAASVHPIQNMHTEFLNAVEPTRLSSFMCGAHRRCRLSYYVCVRRVGRAGAADLENECIIENTGTVLNGGKVLE